MKSSDKLKKTVKTRGKKPSLADKRTYERKPVSTPAAFKLAHNKDQDFSGVTVDQSSGGLGLYTFTNIPEGLFLEIESDAVKGSKKKKRRLALVKWSRKIRKDLYRVGISYID